MKKIKIILSVSVLLSSTLVQAAAYKREEGTCFPPNTVKNFRGVKSLSGGLSEDEFNQVVESAFAVLNPEVKKNLSKNLIIEKRWADDTVDAFATRDDQNNAVIVMNGGLARHPLMTKDAFLLFICHELGHHLGGAPKILRGNSGLRGWSSAEGQADYYATSKCLPLFYKSSVDIKTFELDLDSSDYVTAISKCSDHSCARIILAGLTASRLFSSLVPGEVEPQLAKKDPTRVGKTVYKHSNPQCRLDTYTSGAVCEKSTTEPFDLKDPKIGACLTELDKRPSCWFQEKDF